MTDIREQIAAILSYEIEESGHSVEATKAYYAKLYKIADEILSIPIMKKCDECLDFNVKASKLEDKTVYYIVSQKIQGNRYYKYFPTEQEAIKNHKDNCPTCKGEGNITKTIGEITKDYEENSFK